MIALPLSVRIVTNPRNSPFKIDSRVEFTCEVDPAPIEQVIYENSTSNLYMENSRRCMEAPHMPNKVS